MVAMANRDVCISYVSIPIHGKPCASKPCASQSNFDVFAEVGFDPSAVGFTQWQLNTFCNSNRPGTRTTGMEIPKSSRS